MSAQSQPTTNGGVRPGAGRPVGSRGRRQKLIDNFIAELGGPDRITPLQRIEAERCASLTILVERMRALALSGESVDPADLSRTESTWDRAVRRLNLPAPSSAAPAPNIHDHAAKRAAMRANPQPAEEAD